MSIQICVDPIHYFHCAQCDKLVSRDRKKEDKMRFCLECSQVLCESCQSHEHKTIEVTPEELNTRLNKAYKNYMPHLFPENAQVKG